MKEKLEGDALFYSFLFQVIRFVSIVVVIVIYMSYAFAKDETPPSPPSHVCEVTSADLKALMVVVDKKLATRDNIMEGLQRQLYDKQNGVKKK